MHVGSILVVSLCARAALAGPPAPEPIVERELVAELARLGAAADREEAASPRRPGPSRELAYYLLVGLAADGSAAPAKLIGDLHLRRCTGSCKRQVVGVGAGAVALSEDAIQDKAGTYVVRSADYYVPASTGWKLAGSGQSTR
jgi:hypothetical protein